MRLVILFRNVGGYHAARIQAVADALRSSEDRVFVLQEFTQTTAHPWGSWTRIGSIRVMSLDDSRTILDVVRHENVIPTTIGSVLTAISPDVVTIPGWGSTFAREALSWCRRHAVPTVVMSESKYDDKPRFWLTEKLKGMLYVRRFNAALVGGQAHHDYLVGLGLPANKVFLGYDVVDNNYFSEGVDAIRTGKVATRGAQIPDNNFFLIVSRLIARKNITRLVAAYAQYCHTVTHVQAWNLVICGSGNQEALIRQSVTNYGLHDKVRCPGFVDYVEILPWYAAAQCLVHPALTEQWGLVINEACASGLPILSSATVGAAAELVQSGSNGFLFDARSTSSMADSLVTMHRLSKVERLRMGEHSRNIIADWSPARFAQGLLQAIETAINSPA